MRTYLILFILCLISQASFAQNQSDSDKVSAAAMDYIDAFYEGDTTKLKRSLKPSLYKLGFWKNKDSKEYGEARYMTFEKAIEFVLNVKEKQEAPDPNWPKMVEVLDVMDKIAVCKVSARWGYDYLLLSKEGDKWMIEQVIWQGPYVKP